MRRSVRRGGCWAGLLVWLAGAAQAQISVSQTSIATELQNLAGRAKVVFVGQIASIDRRNSVVEVTFRVEQPVAGAAGTTYTMREWAGLWPAGHMRYAVGQRVLAFLNGASGVGFSSPVHGAEGLVPVIVQGADAPKLLDVRRVAASVVRAPGTPLPTQAEGAIALSDVLSLLAAAGRQTSLPPARVAVPVRGRLPREMDPVAGALGGRTGVVQNTDTGSFAPALRGSR